MFFSITYATDISVIGHYPQTTFMKGYNPRLPHSHWQVKRDEFPKFNPNYELELHQKAIATNFIDGTSLAHGFLIDEQFEKIITNFNLPSYRLYPIKVLHKNKLLKYSWLHWIVKDFWNTIDFEKTTIKKFRNIDFSKFEIFPLSSEENLSKIKKEKERGYTLVYDKIQFKMPINYDLYEIQGLGRTVILSEKLLKALEEAQMTGFAKNPYHHLAL